MEMIVKPNSKLIQLNVHYLLICILWTAIWLIFSPKLLPPTLLHKVIFINKVYVIRKSFCRVISSVAFGEKPQMFFCKMLEAFGCIYINQTWIRYVFHFPVSFSIFFLSNTLQLIRVSIHPVASWGTQSARYRGWETTTCLCYIHTTLCSMSCDVSSYGTKS